MKRVLAILAAAGLFILPAAATAHPAPDVPRITLGIKLLEAPVERRDDPRASSYIIDHLAPGSTIRRRLEVVNDSSEPLRLGMYAGKAGIHKGRFVYPRTAGATNSPTGSPWSPPASNCTRTARHGCGPPSACPEGPRKANATA